MCHTFRTGTSKPRLMIHDISASSREKSRAAGAESGSGASPVTSPAAFTCTQPVINLSPTTDVHGQSRSGLLFGKIAFAIANFNSPFIWRLHNYCSTFLGGSNQIQTVSISAFLIKFRQYHTNERNRREIKLLVGPKACPLMFDRVL